MKTKFLLLYLIIALSFPVFAFEGKDINKLLGGGKEGTEFWFSPIPMYDNDVGYTILVNILIITDSVANVSIEVPGKSYQMNTVVKPYILNKVSIYSDDAFPYIKSAYEYERPDSIYPGIGIHILADRKVLVCCVVYTSYSSDGFIVLPTEKLGKEYICTSYSTDPMFSMDKYGKLKLPTLCSVTATSDSTHIKFMMSGVDSLETAGGLKSGQSVDITLNKGDVYLVSSKGPNGDLAGSRIISDKPVAVVSGNMCTDVPAGNSWCDYTTEMELPVNYYGQIFPVASVKGRKHPSIIRVFAKDTNTIVYRDGISVDTIKIAAGSKGKAFYETRVTDFGDDSLQIAVYATNKPASVTLYNTGTSEDSNSTLNSDPFSMAILPLEHFIKDITFCNPGYQENYIQLVYQTDSIGKLPDDFLIGKLNKGNLVWTKLSSLYPEKDKIFKYKINNNIFAVKTITVYVDDFLRLKANNPFAAYSIGFNTYDSYGFPASISDCGFSPIFNSLDTLGPEISIDSSCNGYFHIKAWDLPDDSTIRGGFKQIIIDSSSSYNEYFGQYGYISDDTLFNFFCEPQNQLKPSHAVVQFIDMYGNTTTKAFDYQPSFLLSPNRDNDTIPFDIRQVNKAFTIFNISSNPITISHVLLYNGNFDSYGTIVLDTAYIPYILKPNDSLQVKYTLINDKYGTYNNEIIVYDSCGILFRFPVSIFSTVSIDSVSNLTIIPETLDFGQVLINKFVNKDEMIKNNSLFFRSSVRVSLLHNSNYFALENSSLMLEPQTTKGCRIDFHGDSIGFYSDSLIVKFKSNDNKYIPIIGEVVKEINNIDDKTQNENNFFDILPSPAFKQATIRFKLTEPAYLACDLTYLNGALLKILFEEKYFEQGEQDYYFDLSSYPDGIYFIRVKMKGNIYTKKFIIVR